MGVKRLTHTRKTLETDTEKQSMCEECKTTQPASRAGKWGQGGRLLVSGEAMKRVSAISICSPHALGCRGSSCTDARILQAHNLKVRAPLLLFWPFVHSAWER